MVVKNNIMKHNHAGDDDSELYAMAKRMTREEMKLLAEELERRAVILRQLSCGHEFFSNQILLGHLRRSLGPIDPEAN